MNCGQNARRIPEYLDNSLDAAARKAIETHLSSCDRCRAEADLLAECMRQVASLAQVEPPIGFAQRVIAHVKEIETKPNFWDGLFLAFKISFPIHATALVVIGIVAVYIVAQEPYRRAVITPWTFSIGSTRQETASTRANHEIPPVPAKTAPVAAEAVSKGGRTPALESDHEAGRDLEARQAESSPSTPVRLAPRTAPRVAAAPAAQRSEISTSPNRLPQRPQRAKISPAIPVASDPKALSTPLSQPAPAPLDLLEGVGGSPPLASELPRVSVAPDVEIVIRRRVQSTQQNVAMQKPAAGARLASEQKIGNSADLLLPKLPDSATRDAILLSIPENRYERLKTDLLAIGTIESESRHVSAENATIPATEGQLRVLVIILPADPTAADREALPSR
jgi:hypothetical protein